MTTPAAAPLSSGCESGAKGPFPDREGNEQIWLITDWTVDVSEKQSWSTGTRIGLLLAVGFMLGLAWIGGRMSAGGAAPVGLMREGMDGSTHMDTGRGGH